MALVAVASMGPAASVVFAAPLAQEEHGLSQSAVEIARPFGLPITNSMVMTWIVAAGLIVFARLATRRCKPSRPARRTLRNGWSRVSTTFSPTSSVPHLVDRTFWLFASIFIFILAANWMSLFPGIGSIGWGHQTPDGFRLDEPFFRGANADVNLTLAMALVFFAAWIVWGLQRTGRRWVSSRSCSRPRARAVARLRVLLIVVFLAAGCLEVVSILFRPISLSFRLYGNVFAGESMLETMARIPRIGWLVQVPFYFLELLVGLVQALVFMLLTAVFTLLICQHEHEGEGAGAASPAGEMSPH